MHATDPHLGSSDRAGPARPTLVSFDLCPYVQRAAIVLAEKNVAFDRVTVDLANKPAWFTEISPLGKVPLLREGDTVLFESQVIAEYLDETRGPRLHPAGPLERAHHRAWIETGSAILADVWMVETSPDPAVFEARKTALRAKFARVEAVLGDGPYFAGARFSLVDAAFAPVFRYFDVFERFVDLGAFTGLTKVPAWRRALAARPSVRGAVPADYPARLEAFLRRQPSHLAHLMDAVAA